MTDDERNVCLICKQTFSDHLVFFEHVMSHGDVHQAGSEGKNDVSYAAVVASDNGFEGRLQGKSASLSSNPSDGETTTPCKNVQSSQLGPVVASYGSLSQPERYHHQCHTHYQMLGPNAQPWNHPRDFNFHRFPSTLPYYAAPPPSTISPTIPLIQQQQQQQQRPCRAAIDLTTPPGTPQATEATAAAETRTTRVTTDRNLEQSISEQYWELETFAARFKEWRVKMGYTQAAVGQSMEKHYGIVFSQTTVSRFEALQLNFHNLKKLRPVFEEWLRLEEQELSRQPPDTRIHLRRRKKRTTFKRSTKDALEVHFKRQPTPSASDYTILADALDLDKEVVRIWFCNRRQKERKTKDGLLDFENI